jgi:hypothetical protein
MKTPIRLFLVLFSAFVLAGTTARAQVVVLGIQPEAAEGSYNFTASSGWGADLTSLVIQAPVVLIDDGTAADSLGCNPAVNANQLAGKIAFIYRGTCEFGVKSLNAQNAGAVAVIMVNNVPGDPIVMGAGAVGASVTIPVVMISNVDGAFLRPFVDSGELEMLIGNKTGLFDNDLGFLKRHVVMAKNSVTPSSFAQSSADFNIPVAAWVHNYGSENQTGVTLTAKVSLGANELYNETSAPVNILSGDSALVVLPVFGLDTYPNGLYTLNYQISSSVADEFPNDNSRDVTFWINDQGFYAKSRMNNETAYPVAGGGVRPSTGSEYTWCTMLRSANAAAEQIHAVSFSTLTNNNVDLTGQVVYVEVFRWNDPLDEMSTAVTFNDLELVGEKEYDYPADYQSEFVSAVFDSPLPLVNNQKYLVCASLFSDNMFFRVDGGIDYNLNYDAYPADIFFPIISGGQWFAGGFGTDYVPAIITHFSEPNFPIVSVGEKPLAKLPVRAYPNPANDYITIPMGHQTNGNVLVSVFDMNGREVMNRTVNQGFGSNVQLDINGLNNGLYTFRLTQNNDVISTFKVVISR